MKFWTLVGLLLISTLLEGANGKIEIKVLKTHVITESCQLQDFHERQIDLNSLELTDQESLPFLNKSIAYEDQESYWVSCEIVNETDKQDWIVKLPFLTITNGDLYLVTNGRIDRGPVKLGVFEKRGREDAYLSIGRKFIYTHINLYRGETYHLVLRLQNQKQNQSIDPYIHLIPEDRAFQYTQTSLSVWFSIFSGCVIIMAFLAFVLYQKTRDNSYWYYGMYIFSLLMWASFSDGILREWCFNYLTFIEPKYFFLLRSFGIIGTFYYVRFIIEFADLNSHFLIIKKYYKYLLPLGWLLVFIDWSVLVLSNFNLNYSNLVGIISMTIWMVFNLVMIPPLWKIRDQPYIKITLGGLILVSAGLVPLFIRMALNNFGTVGALEIFVTTTLELFLFSYGLSLKLSDYIKVQSENETIRTLLAEKDTLLREIHHRVKNNLQVVSSLLRIQSNETSDPIAIGALKEGQSRIQSMSLIHQDLYQQDNLSGINMKEYLNKLVHNLFDTYNISADRITCTTDIDPIVLDIDRVVPLGLVINELISNALKYAFSEGNSGSIDVQFKRKADHLLLTVTDDGIGITKDSDQKKSTGFSLINAFLLKLDGEMSINSENGTKVTVLIKDY